MLFRSLGHEGRTWTAPAGDAAAPLTGDELAQWLTGAGFQAGGAAGTAQLTLGGFAGAVYRAIS